MSSRLSILSVAEQNFVRQKLMNSRRQQLEQLSLDITLHEFVSSVSSEDEITAWNQDGALVTWKADSGFFVEFPDGFFSDISLVNRCFKAVRQAYFENFLSPEDRELLSQPGLVVMESEPADAPAAAQLAHEPELEVVPTVLEQSAEEQSEHLLEPAEAETVEVMAEAEVEQQVQHHFDDEDDDEDLLSKMEDLGSRKIVDHDGLDADEFSNLGDDDDSESVSHTAHEPVAEENQDEAMNALLAESEPVDEVEVLKMEMLATGMDEGKANKLLAAVRSGKATVDAVRQTLKKLSGS
ncbi:MAG: hypothetical protein H3C47_16025 [Candidatus Cloacimonetes bacterium]|nr:hypothetical protein [Candidatus Cloacimonadota bacterium]